MQKGETCSAYSIAGYLEWLFFNELKQAKQVDAEAFAKETTLHGEGQKLGVVLDYAKQKGVPLVDGTRYKIKDYQRYLPQWTIAESGLKISPMVFTMKIPLGLSLDEVVAKPPNVLSQLFKVHSMVLCGFDSIQQEFKVANSRGSNFGNLGYFKLPYQLFNQMNVLDLYDIKL